MTSRERLLSVLAGRTTDRVPISTYELVGWNPDAWENREPSYRPLMDLVRRCTDCVYMWDSGGVEVDPSRCTVETWRDAGGRFTRKVVHAGSRTLTSLSRETPRVKTVWEVERLLKTEEDVRAFLDLPLVVRPPDVDGFRRRSEALGDRGIMMHSISDALCIAAELFSFSDFMLFCVTERRLVRRIMDKVEPLVLAHAESLLEAGFGPLFRVCGPEYATPPYLPPAAFREFVVAYDGPLIDLLRRRGRLVRLHVHGKIGRVLDQILELAPDALDPVEPPPDGDITLAEVKRRAGGELTVFGNIELTHLEHGTREQVESLTRRALEEGMPGGRFVVMPTAAPINVPLAPRTLENYRCFIETALARGRYGG